MTEYILFANKEGNEWVQFTAMQAHSARQAIAKALAGDNNSYKQGTFVAVPVRSWQPLKVKVETKTALKFS